MENSLGNQMADMTIDQALIYKNKIEQLSEDFTYTIENKEKLLETIRSLKRSILSKETIKVINVIFMMKDESLRRSKSFGIN